MVGLVGWPPGRRGSGAGSICRLGGGPVQCGDPEGALLPSGYARRREGKAPGLAVHDEEGEGLEAGGGHRPVGSVTDTDEDDSGAVSHQLRIEAAGSRPHAAVRAQVRPVDEELRGEKLQEGEGRRKAAGRYACAARSRTGAGALKSQVRRASSPTVRHTGSPRWKAAYCNGRSGPVSTTTRSPASRKCWK